MHLWGYLHLLLEIHKNDYHSLHQMFGNSLSDKDIFILCSCAYFQIRNVKMSFKLDVQINTGGLFQVL